jgi:hypothetical protein
MSDTFHYRDPDGMGPRYPGPDTGGYIKPLDQSLGLNGRRVQNSDIQDFIYNNKSAFGKNSDWQGRNRTGDRLDSLGYLSNFGGTEQTRRDAARLERLLRQRQEGQSRLDSIRAQRLRLRPPASTLRRQPKNVRLQEYRLASGELIPLVYGRAQVAGLAVEVAERTTDYDVEYVLAIGRIDGVNAVYANGTQISTSDWSESLGSDWGKVTVTFDKADYPSVPDVIVDIDGLRVATSAGGTPVYSDDPTFHLIDFIENSDYGLGLSVDWANVSASGLSRSFTLISPTDQYDVLQMLANNARSYVRFSGSLASIELEGTASSVRSITTADIIAGTLSVRLKDMAQVPNVVTVAYTDASNDIDQDALSDEYVTQAVTDGLERRRVSIVRVLGIRSKFDADEEAERRLAQVSLATTEVRFEMFDDGLELQLGDVIDLTHPVGFSGYLLRIVTEPQQTRSGRWVVEAETYDDAMYGGGGAPS